MENLLSCNGRKFTAKIQGVDVTGRIRVEDGSVYLCQDVKDGEDCADKLGYNFIWKVGDGSAEILAFNNFTDFRLHPITAKEIKAYKDWQVGDKLAEGCFTIEVIFRSGELVVCKNEDGEATGVYTCNELYGRGFRLVAEPEEEDIVEVTMDEIAKLKGVPVERLHIKKE